MIITLSRFAYTPQAVFGRLQVNGYECYTLELPWCGNEKAKSCIPEGEYKIVLGRFNRGGYPAYEVLDVPDRKYIKIHIGNTVNDIHGCIAVGKELGVISGKFAVTSSRKAYNEFMAATGGQRQGTILIKSIFETKV